MKYKHNNLLNFKGFFLGSVCNMAKQVVFHPFKINIYIM